jgi:hypothetical protein
MDAPTRHGRARVNKGRLGIEGRRRGNEPLGGNHGGPPVHGSSTTRAAMQVHGAAMKLVPRSSALQRYASAPRACVHRHGSLHPSASIPRGEGLGPLGMRVDPRGHEPRRRTSVTRRSGSEGIWPRFRGSEMRETSAKAVGQVWRGRQARLAQALRAIKVEPLDSSLGRSIGELLGASGWPTSLMPASFCSVGPTTAFASAIRTTFCDPGVDGCALRAAPAAPRWLC